MWFMLSISFTLTLSAGPVIVYFVELSVLVMYNSIIVIVCIIATHFFVGLFVCLFVFLPSLPLLRNSMSNRKSDPTLGGIFLISNFLFPFCLFLVVLALHLVLGDYVCLVIMVSDVTQGTPNHLQFEVCVL